MNIEIQSLVITLLESIATDAHEAQKFKNPEAIRIYLFHIREAVAEIEQRLPPAETALKRAKRLMPDWPNRLCPTDYTKDFPDEIDENS